MSSDRRKSRKRQPQQRRSRETAEVLVQATAHILSRDGAEHITTNHVADTAGVSIGSLYQYFDNKEELVEEVRRRYGESFRQRLLVLAARAATLPIGEAIAECVSVLIDLHAENPGLHNAVSADGPGAGERRMRHQVILSWLEARSGEVRRPNRPLAAALALDVAEALIHGAALRTPERLRDQEFAAEVTDLLVRYLVK
jgi:AcrR family transcriptional regulator